jgi:hypothetical protein
MATPLGTNQQVCTPHFIIAVLCTQPAARNFRFRAKSVRKPQFPLDGQEARLLAQGIEERQLG